MAARNSKGIMGSMEWGSRLLAVLAVLAVATGAPPVSHVGPVDRSAGGEGKSRRRVPPPTLLIREIQGRAHISPYEGWEVADVTGIVTAVKYNGFWMQDPSPDTDDATSEGIFVYTAGDPAVIVGEELLVDGTVTEYRGGGDNLTVTEITDPYWDVQSSGNTLPAPVLIGTGGRIPPMTVINDDGTGNVEDQPPATFDETTDGIDFYESLEGMRVQLNNAIVVGPSSWYGETWVVGDAGANAATLTPRGGIVIGPADFNPERVQLEDDLYPGAWPALNVGATFTSPAIGVVHYSYDNFEVLVTDLLTTDTTGEVTAETTALVGAADKLTVATFNVENLGGDEPQAEFEDRAAQIVNHLQSPDIIALEEMQDDNGSTDNGTVTAAVTFNKLITAIQNAGGPTYAFQQIDPQNNYDGGEPGGNIRVGFLYNTARVTFNARPGGDATTPNTVTCTAGGAELDLNPGRIDPTNAAYNGSRKPLAGEFEFNGQTVHVIGIHFGSKGGDDPLYGVAQPPVLSSEAKRIAQAQPVNDFVDTILACDPNANIVVLGDVNDYQFSPPVDTLKGGALSNLVDLLPANERYSYIYQGNAQVLDQILVSGNLFNNSSPEYDVVHVNAEFLTQVSDHDPSVARFTFESPTIIHIWQDNGAVRDDKDNVNPDGPASIQARNNGITTCTIEFSEDVNVQPSDVLIRDVDDTMDLIAPDTFDYVPAQHILTMTWSDETFVNQWVRIHVLDSVTSVNTGAALDGEIYETSSTPASGLALDGELPSGDGAAGGTSMFVLGALTGDVDGNRAVNSADRLIVKENQGSPEDIPSDVDGNGVINSFDRLLVKQNQEDSLSAPPLP